MAHALEAVEKGGIRVWMIVPISMSLVDTMDSWLGTEVGVVRSKSLAVASTRTLLSLSVVLVSHPFALLSPCTFGLQVVVTVVAAAVSNVELSCAVAS